MDIFTFFALIVVCTCLFGFVVFIIGQLRLRRALSRVNRMCINQEREYKLDKAIQLEVEKNLRRMNE